MASHRNKKRSAIPNLAGSSRALPRHGTTFVVRHGLRTTLVSFVLAAFVFVGTAAAAVWVDLNHTIESNSLDVVAQDGEDDTENELIDPNAGQTIEFLVLGQDTREGEGNSSIGGSDSSLTSLHNADTTMVVQIAADRSYINLISIPRDSMVSVPACTTSNGTIPAQSYVQFNSIFANAYSVGGDLASAATCTMSAVNSLTGLELENFIVVDFEGLSEMIDALGGVDLCIPQDVDDSNTGLVLSKGMQHLDGTQATQYARVRYSLGDGSDIMRTTRQQYLIKSLFAQILSKNLLTDTTELYQMARAALDALNISSGMADAATLAGLAMSLSGMDYDNLYAQTIPVTTDPYDSNRVVWASTADDVWSRLRNDQPLVDDDDDEDDESDTTDSDSTGSDDATDDSTTSDDSDDSTDSADDDDTSDDEDEVDPYTGLITETDPYTGEEILIDPDTGGTVDPDSGAIRDSVTGQYIGIADQYLYYTVCGVTEED